MNFTGTKYEATRDLDIAQIAELIRLDIKEAIAAGELPKGIKTSVRISRYSMGRSLDVTVTALPFAEKVSEEQTDDNRAEGLSRPWQTREAYAVQSKLEEIRNAYNRDRSDSMSDYYDVRFGGSVEIRIKAAKAAPAPLLPPNPAERAANRLIAAEGAAKLARARHIASMMHMVTFAAALSRPVAVA